MNARQVSSHSTVKKTGTKSVFITAGKHKNHGKFVYKKELECSFNFVL